MSDTFAPGSRLGSYEVVDRLGAGGMGEVYRARDLRLGRTVALKVLRSGADPELLHRLDREARAASALNHPNIVHIYDVGQSEEHAGVHYVVMEHVEGETLRRVLARGPLPMPELLDLGAQFASGLAKAHRAGIVHRDLKPENLMVTPDGLLKILDFGLAKVVFAPLGDVDAQQTLSRHGTQIGMLLGTLEYMSPEQAAGRAVDLRTDQFAVGLILHEMATGRPVFRRDTPAQVLAAVIEREPEPLGTVRSDVPPPLAALVTRCLQKDPAQRFATTDELAAELLALSGRSRSGFPSPVASTMRSTATAPVMPTPPTTPTPAPAAAVYHVEQNRKIRDYDEKRLVELIRRGKLTGVELVRRDDEAQWQPLFESNLFRREVPSTGDPRDIARERMLRGLGGHFTGFVITAVVMMSVTHQFPFWMWIWGVVLALQSLGSLPAAIALFRRRRAQGGDVPAVVEAPRLPPPPAAPPSPVAQEGARVRALIEQRGGKDTARLLSDVDAILKLAGDLDVRQADLEEQTSAAERTELATAITEARARLARAEQDQDRRLFERQLEVLQSREEAIRKALAVLERLRVRRQLAEHQLKQLRLDLSRGAASGLDVPELSSRLEFIRFEVDAKAEVDGIAAGRG